MHRTRQLGDVDDLGARHLVLELHDPALDKALPVAGRVVFGVFGQIAVVSRLGDGADDGRPVDGLQALQLLPEPIEAFGRHRDLVHREQRLDPAVEMPNTAASAAAEQSKV